MNAQALGKRNEIAKAMMLGAPAARPQAPAAGFTYPSAPMAAPQAVPYKEAGFGYTNTLTPMEEIGMAARKWI